MILGCRVAQVDPADIGGHVEPDERQPGHRGVQPRVDPAPVADDLDAHARGTMIVILPAGVDVQVHDVIVELGLGEVSLGDAQVRTNVRLRWRPATCRQPQPPKAAVDLQRPGQRRSWLIPAQRRQ